MARLVTPDRDGRRANIALDFPSLAGYVEHTGHYFGATVGRYLRPGAVFASTTAFRFGVRNDRAERP